MDKGSKVVFLLQFFFKLGLTLTGVIAKSLLESFVSFLVLSWIFFCFFTTSYFVPFVFFPGQTEVSRRV